MEFTVLEVIGIMALALNIVTALLWSFGFLRYTITVAERSAHGDVAHIEKTMQTWLREFFTPGTHVAFVASHPSYPDAGMCLSNYVSLDDLIKAIESNKGHEQ